MHKSEAILELYSRNLKNKEYEALCVKSVPGSMDSSKIVPMSMTMLIKLTIFQTFQPNDIFHYSVFSKHNIRVNTFKYHVFASMGRFQLELIYLYSPPSFHLTVGCFCPDNNERHTGRKQPTVRWKDGGK